MTAEISEKREAILRATLDLLVERGFHDTPTSLIAREAGVATGTLFHHFKNKDELINALYLETKSAMVEVLKQGMKSSDLIEERVRSVWLNGVKWGIMHPREYQFFQQFSNSPFITKLTLEEASSQFGFFDELIEEIVESDNIKNMDSEFFRDYFESMFVLGINHFRKYPGRISEDNMNRIFDICWNGVAAEQNDPF